MANERNLDLSEAPGGDMSLDDIFADINSGTPTQQTLTQDPGVEEPEMFLTTATGSVYKTAEDAIKGIEHKDALIAQLREAATKQTPVTQNQQNNEVDQNYIRNPKLYVDDLKNAKSEEQLVNVQTRLVNDAVAPYLPLLGNLAKSRAVEEVMADVPEFVKFQRSDAYKTTVEQFPLLKRSIEIAESNPQAAGDLAQLYRMAYHAAAGQTLSKIAPVTRQVTQEARPTLASTQVVPPTRLAAPPSLQSADGRKSIIDNQEAAGVLDLRF